MDYDTTLSSNLPFNLFKEPAMQLENLKRFGVSLLYALPLAFLPGCASKSSLPLEQQKETAFIIPAETTGAVISRINDTQMSSMGGVGRDVRPGYHEVTVAIFRGGALVNENFTYRLYKFEAKAGLAYIITGPSTIEVANRFDLSQRLGSLVMVGPNRFMSQEDVAKKAAPTIDRGNQQAAPSVSHQRALDAQRKFNELFKGRKLIAKIPVTKPFRLEIPTQLWMAFPLQIWPRLDSDHVGLVKSISISYSPEGGVGTTTNVFNKRGHVVVSETQDTSNKDSPKSRREIAYLPGDLGYQVSKVQPEFATLENGMFTMLHENEVIVIDTNGNIAHWGRVSNGEYRRHSEFTYDAQGRVTEIVMPQLEMLCHNKIGNELTLIQCPDEKITLQYSQEGTELVVTAKSNFSAANNSEFRYVNGRLVTTLDAKYLSGSAQPETLRCKLKYKNDSRGNWIERTQTCESPEWKPRTTKRKLTY